MDEYQTKEERRIWLEKLAERRWSKEVTKAEDDLIIANPQDFQPKDRGHLDYCKHCGVPFSSHLGMTATCARLQKIFALVEAHRHYTDPEAAHIMCEKIMELKGLQDE